MAQTAEQIQTIISEAGCCLATRQATYIKGTWNGQNSQCSLYENILLNSYIETLSRYTPVGSILVPSVISVATFDFSSIGLPAFIDGEVTVGADVLGAVSANFTTLLQLLAALAAAINLNPSGENYTATYTATELLVHAPSGSGSSLNGVMVTISINPYFFVDDSVSTGTVSPDETHGICCVNNPLSLMYGYMAVCSTLTDEVFIYNDTTLVTTITLPAGTEPNECCYDSFNDAIYVACVTAPIQKIAAASNPVLGTPLAAGTSGCTHISFNTFNNCKYGSIQGGNSFIKINTSDSVAATLGCNTPVNIGINTVTGEMWVGSSATTNCFVVDATTHLLTTTLVMGAIGCTFSYYPASSPVTARFLISNISTDRVQTWNAISRVIDNANFIIPDTAAIGSVYYSALFDKIFVGIRLVGQMGVEVYNTDGTDHTVPVLSTDRETVSMADNVRYGYLARAIYITSASEQPNVQYIDLEPNFADIEAPLLGGTPTIYATAADNCITAAQAQKITSYIKKLCRNICGCSSATSTLDESVIQVLGIPASNEYIDAEGNPIIVN